MSEVATMVLDLAKHVFQAPVADVAGAHRFGRFGSLRRGSIQMNGWAKSYAMRAASPDRFESRSRDQLQL